MDVFDTIKEISGSLKHSCANGLSRRHVSCRQQRDKGGTNGESEVPGDKKDGIAESNGIVHMIVVEDDGRTEDNPYRDDSCSRDFGAQRFGRGGGGGWERRRGPVAV